MKLDKDLIRGDFNFKIVSGSTSSESDMIRLQKAKLLFDFAMQNPLIDRVESTKVIMELGGFEEYVGRLMRNPAEVQREAQMRAQQRLQAEIAVDKPKRDTDLQKTQMKSMTALQQEQMRQAGETQRTKADNQTKTLTKMFDMAKDRSKDNGN